MDDEDSQDIHEESPDSQEESLDSQESSQDSRDEPSTSQFEKPHSKELDVGFFSTPFELLKKISEENNVQDIPTICSLLIDESKLSQKYEKFKGKTFGYTEGMGKRRFNEPRKMASKAVVFMVVSLLDNWKIPIALFFVHNPDIKHFADTIEEALIKLHEIDITIVSISMNCVSPHLSFALAEELGAEIDYIKSTTKNMSPCFLHPSDSTPVYIMYDFHILVGALKTYWGTRRVFVYKNKKIEYSLTTRVKTVQETDLQVHGMNTVYDWVIIRKRLCYDTENVSKTTADAIAYLKDLGHPDFKKSGATIQFIQILDRIARIAEADHISGVDVDSPLGNENESDWKPLLERIRDYFKHLKAEDEELPNHLSLFKVYITGLIVSLTALIQIYEDHVSRETCPMKYLLPDRLCLKHLGRLFKNWTHLEEKASSALDLFKNMKLVIKSIHPIN